MDTKKTKLRIARDKTGLTQVEVANKAKVTARAYQYYEKGDRTPSIKTAKRLAQALNSTIEELF